MNRCKDLAYCDVILLGYKKNGHNKLPYDICFSIQGKEMRLPWYGKCTRTKVEECWDKRLIVNKKIGSIQISDNQEGFYFECYLDQSLRRKPELDIIGIHADIDKNIPCVGWKSNAHPEGFLAPWGVIPHYSNYVSDESNTLTIKVPKEFEAICQEFDISSEILLNDFIDNVCNLSTSVFAPRADFRFCKDPLLHKLAIAYVRSIYRRRENI